MTKTIASIVLTAVLAVVQFPSGARTVKSTRVEDGGNGPYKAVIVEDDALPGFSIFRPEDLKSAASVEGPLPVILFGNGGCAHSSTGFYGFLTEIASHGYVIISNGVWRESQPVMTGGRPVPVTTPPAGVQSQGQGQAPAMPRPQMQRPQGQGGAPQGAGAMPVPASDPSRQRPFPVGRCLGGSCQA